MRVCACESVFKGVCLCACMCEWRKKHISVKHGPRRICPKSTTKFVLFICLPSFLTTFFIKRVQNRHRGVHKMSLNDYYCFCCWSCEVFPHSITAIFVFQPTDSRTDTTFYRDAQSHKKAGHFIVPVVDALPQVIK